MKEYNFDAAKRKFLGTVLYYDNKGALDTGLCNDIDCLADKTIVYLLSNGDMTSDPLYKPTNTGIYRGKEDPSQPILVTRSPKKTFKIGFCNETHQISLLSPNKVWDNVHPGNVNILKPIQCTKNDIEKSLLNYGPISNKFWVLPGKIFYLRKQVGIRKGSTFLINDTLKPFLEDILAGFNIKLV